MNECLFVVQIIALLLIGRHCVQHSRSLAAMGLVVMVLAANGFALFPVSLFGWHVTGSDAYYIASVMMLSLIQERYGSEVANELLQASFFILFFVLVMLLVQSLYSSPLADFCLASMRVLSASLLVWGLSQSLDLFLFGLFRPYCAFSWAAMAATLLSQACDTALFSLLALYGQVSHVLDIIIFSYLIKVMITMVMSLTLFGLSARFSQQVLRGSAV